MSRQQRHLRFTKKDGSRVHYNPRALRTFAFPDGGRLVLNGEATSTGAKNMLDFGPHDHALIAQAESWIESARLVPGAAPDAVPAPEHLALDRVPGTSARRIHDALELARAFEAELRELDEPRSQWQLQRFGTVRVGDGWIAHLQYSDGYGGAVFVADQRHALVLDYDHEHTLMPHIETPFPSIFFAGMPAEWDAVPFREAVHDIDSYTSHTFGAWLDGGRWFVTGFFGDRVVVPAGAGTFDWDRDFRPFQPQLWQWLTPLIEDRNPKGLVATFLRWALEDPSLTPEDARGLLDELVAAANRAAAAESLPALTAIEHAELAALIVSLTAD